MYVECAKVVYLIYQLTTKPNTMKSNYKISNKVYVTWYSKDTVMPDLNKYVLIETKFCKYPSCVGYYNGLNWISADDKAIIQNVDYWAEIN